MLKDKINDIIEHIRLNVSNYTQICQKLQDAYNDQFLQLVEESLRSEMLPAAFDQIKKRIFPLNIIPRYTDKIAKAYQLEPLRQTVSEVEQDLVDNLANYLDVNSLFGTADKFLTLHNSCAIEIYVYENQLKTRVIPASQFIVYSENQVEPNSPEVFIKFVGSIKTNKVLMDSQGIKNTSYGNEVREVALFFMYTNDEFLIVDGSGTIRTDLMTENNLDGINHYGFVPIVYCRRDPTTLVNLPASDLLPIAINIATSITDLNYAAKFQSHSITYAIDLNITKADEVDRNPDQLWALQSIEDAKSPQIGVIKPSVDIAQVLQLIQFQMSAFLETKGIKSGSIGNSTVTNAASGIAKLIDEADASAVIKTHITLWKKYEVEFWLKLAKMFNLNKSSLILPNWFPTNTFSDNFTILIDFEEATAIKTDEQVLAEIKVEKELDLISQHQALKKWKPNLTNDQIEELWREIKDEKMEGTNNEVRGRLKRVGDSNSPIDQTRTTEDSDEAMSDDQGSDSE